MNFAIIGVAGYVAPRHLRAISDTKNRLVAATDPHDSVGILDQYSFDVRYFPEIERFDRYLDRLRRGPEENRVHFVSICSPNYLHDAHIRLALRVGAHAICEKPLVINPWNLDALEELELETGKRVYPILQLRVHPALIELKKKIEAGSKDASHDVVLTYVTSRGSWYDASWKGNEERSGGIAVNIGIHFFDLLIWLFGDVCECVVHLKEPKKMAGYLELRNARVRWFLSVDFADMPASTSPGKKTTYRSIEIDGQEVEFTEGFTDLHTQVYKNTLSGTGFTIRDARASIEAVRRIRTSSISRVSMKSHPYLIRRNMAMAETGRTHALPSP